MKQKIIIGITLIAAVALGITLNKPETKSKPAPAGKINIVKAV